MPIRKLSLLFSSIIVLALFFLLPRNRQWIGILTGYWKNLPAQKASLGLEARMKLRFGNSYTYSKDIADSLKKRTPGPDAVVLMPPTSYFRKMGLTYHVPEPAVFYYFTGSKTIWANSKDAINANWYVRVHDGKIILDSVTDRKALQDTITEFKKLGVSL